MGSIYQEKVGQAYDFLEISSRLGKTPELTEGIYNGDLTTPYEVAQENQINWLLDKVDCRKGTRLLDIGCGNGSFISMAQSRGAQATGITLSTKQRDYCISQGLDVILVDWRNIPRSWDDRFDAVIANGSIEHFVDPYEARLNCGDEIYRRLFQTCNSILKPDGRMATTVIHFRDRIANPAEIMKDPFSFEWGSFEFHTAILERSLGGWYPHDNQLQRCANSLFSCITTVDGTEDYRLTSEYWIKEWKHALFQFSVFPKIFIHACRYPRAAFWAITCIVLTQSWAWQFRGNPTPMQLLRHVWKRI